MSSKTLGLINVSFAAVWLILAELTVQASKSGVVLLKSSAMLTEISVAALIVAVCLLLHVAGLLLMAEWLLQHRQNIERSATRMRFAILLILLFSGIMLLHVVETSLWAVFYYKRGLFTDFETALYFSLTSYTTIGYGDVLLPQRWRLLGAIEGISGVLLCGVSTGFIFAVMNAIFQARMRQHTPAQKEGWTLSRTL